MNTILNAEMFEGDRKQTLAVVQQLRSADNAAELPLVLVRSESRDMMPGMPPSGPRGEFDLIRI